MAPRPNMILEWSSNGRGMVEHWSRHGRGMVEEWSRSGRGTDEPSDATCEFVQDEGGSIQASTHLGTFESGAIARKASTPDVSLEWSRNGQGMAELWHSTSEVVRHIGAVMEVHPPSHMK